MLFKAFSWHVSIHPLRSRVRLIISVDCKGVASNSLLWALESELSSFCKKSEIHFAAWPCLPAPERNTTEIEGSENSRQTPKHTAEINTCVLLHPRWVALVCLSFTHCKSTAPAVKYLEQAMATYKMINEHKETAQTLVEYCRHAWKDEKTGALLQRDQVFFMEGRNPNPSRRFLFILHVINLGR